ncbi:MAG: peptidoglycan-binding protein, partial [Acidimicrobiales bacterium]
TYDERNRLITGPEGDYTWTPRGTLTEIDDGSTTSLYAFDGLGRMTAANEGTAVTYTYDSLDRIAARNGSTSGFEFNGASINPTTDGNSIYTLTPSGSIFALDTPSSSAKVATLNRHGDLQRITNPTDGTTDAHNLTDPWGAPLTSAGDTPDAGFQGDYTDPDTGDVWMGARWYDPDSGTFSSRDTYAGTAGNPKSGNRNLYGEANPNKHWDPTGRLPQEMSVCLSQGGDFAQCERNHAEYLANQQARPTATCSSIETCQRTTNSVLPGGRDGFGSSNLQQGSTGAAVTNWQKALAQAGFSPGTPDGDFGPKTVAATKAFQHASGLTADGIVGPLTKTAMQQNLTGHITSAKPTPVPKETPGRLADHTLISDPNVRPQAPGESQFVDLDELVLVAHVTAIGLEAPDEPLVLDASRSAVLADIAAEAWIHGYPNPPASKLGGGEDRSGPSAEELLCPAVYSFSTCADAALLGELAKGYNEAIFPEYDGHDDVAGNAFQHQLWAATLTATYGEATARSLLMFHELSNPEQTPFDWTMDTFNNEAGIQLALDYPTNLARYDALSAYQSIAYANIIAGNGCFIVDDNVPRESQPDSICTINPG